MHKMKWMHFLALLCFLSCEAQTETTESRERPAQNSTENHIKPFDSNTRTIHVFVALCDNKYQGIVPVSKAQGNGQNPSSNLYWGAAYGIKTFFKKSKDWELISVRKLNATIIERIIFKHKKSNYYLVADAYDGQYIKQTTIDFLRSSCGMIKDTLELKTTTIGIGGNAKLATYIGHDGLMDFDIHEKFLNTDSLKRDVIILACYSKHFFSPHLRFANVNPLVWTSGLMAPEAYILHDALGAYMNQESTARIGSKAALAYNKYQKCGLNAARRLLVGGW